MNFYKRISRRKAKKWLGGDWRKIQHAASLKPGDILNSCRSMNEIIKEIEPVWSNDHRIIWDFDIVFESGMHCSMIHCCDAATSRDYVVKGYIWWVTERLEWYKQWRKEGLEDAFVYKVGMACLNGNDHEMFDDRGLYIGPWPVGGL